MTGSKFNKITLLQVKRRDQELVQERKNFLLLSQLRILRELRPRCTKASRSGSSRTRLDGGGQLSPHLAPADIRSALLMTRLNGSQGSPNCSLSLLGFNVRARARATLDLLARSSFCQARQRASQPAGQRAGLVVRNDGCCAK